MDKNLYKIKILKGEKSLQINTDIHSTIFDALKKIKALSFYTPCMGRGLCGKCKIIMVRGKVTKPDKNELALLNSWELKKGYRLACMTKVLDDIEIKLISTDFNMFILTQGIKRDICINPVIKKKFLTIKQADINNQKSDITRIKEKLSVKEIHVPLNIAKKVHQVITKSNLKVSLVYSPKQIIAIESGNTTKYFYGLAIDIGTTTIVIYLVDINENKVLDVISEINSQTQYGSNVISRIQFTIEHKNGLNTLYKNIITQINRMIAKLARQNNINFQHIYSMVCTGNTVMTHLFCNLPVAQIAVSPFIPVTTDELTYQAAEMGININPEAQVTILPGIAGYVGADIVADILATGMAENDELSLLVDIGTNGEVIIGNKKGLLCCSTAAGPAFEGGHISKGISSVDGAIYSVCIEKNHISYKTINHQPPVGICGTGIIDCIAVFKKLGIIDETGRITNKKHKILKNSILDINGEKAIIITRENKKNGPLYVTQKDIREVQLAKAAIAAGIKILIKKEKRLLMI